jgi:RNA polymerase sigma-70 factor (ECF subfamily)
MAVNFDTTNWSLIVRAHATTTGVRRVALSELCEAYWYPLYSFARMRGASHEDASDLTQGFFVHLIEKHALRGVAPANGRFRAFLLASFKNFQSENRRRAHAQKRGGDRIRIPWDPDLLQTRYQAAAATDEDPEQLYDRQWALTLIDRARARHAAAYESAGKMREYTLLLPYLTPHPRGEWIATLAEALGRNEGAARVALSRFRKRFGDALRAEVASTVGEPAEIESELRFLLEVLSSRGSAAV